jgi:hypothetical protein
MEQFSPAHGTILPPIWELRQFQKIGAPQAACALRRRRLNVRRSRTEARPRALFVNLRFKIGRFFQQGGGNRGVFGYFGELKKNRRLTHEILSTDHGFFPPWYPSANATTRKSGIRSGRMLKSEQFELGHREIRPLRANRAGTRKPVLAELGHWQIQNRPGFTQNLMGSADREPTSEWCRHPLGTSTPERPQLSLRAGADSCGTKANEAG